VEENEYENHLSHKQTSLVASYKFRRSLALEYKMQGKMLDLRSLVTQVSPIHGLAGDGKNSGTHNRFRDGKLVINVAYLTYAAEGLGELNYLVFVTHIDAKDGVRQVHVNFWLWLVPSPWKALGRGNRRDRGHGSGRLRTEAVKKCCRKRCGRDVACMHTREVCINYTMLILLFHIQEIPRPVVLINKQAQSIVFSCSSCNLFIGPTSSRTASMASP
jgi:hypothetical protein